MAKKVLFICPLPPFMTRPIKNPRSVQAFFANIPGAGKKNNNVQLINRLHFRLQESSPFIKAQEVDENILDTCLMNVEDSRIWVEIWPATNVFNQLRGKGRKDELINGSN